jgi:hypothetical protein
MIKHKMTVAALALSLFLIGTTTVLVSCGNDDTKTIVTEPTNAKQLKAFNSAISSLSSVENNRMANSTNKVDQEKVITLFINEATDLLIASGVTEKQLSSMSNNDIISKSFAIYAQESQKQQSLKN